MKKAFNDAMKRGTAGEQKDQWDIFAKLMENYSAHIGERHDELYVEKKERKSRKVSEPQNESLKEQRVVVWEKLDEAKVIPSKTLVDIVGQPIRT